MHRKIFTVIAVVVVMLTTVQPVKVKAQALVEFAISLVVIVLGPGEIGELHWVATSQANPEKPTIQPGNPNRYFTIALDLTDTGDTTCRETIQAQVTAYPSQINTLTLAKNGASLHINGEETILSEPCLFNNIRTAYQIGVSFSSPGLNNSRSPGVSDLALQLPPARVVSYAITDDTGVTHAFHVGTNILRSKTLEPDPPE